MKSILLDSSFIITCVKQKIDFFEEIPLMGMQIIIPEQVIAELKRLNTEQSKLSQQILQKNKFKKIDLGKGHVDKKIIQYVKNKPNIIVATLDREMKKKIKNNKLVIREKKRLEVIS